MADISRYRTAVLVAGIKSNALRSALDARTSSAVNVDADLSSSLLHLCAVYNRKPSLHSRTTLRGAFLKEIEVSREADMVRHCGIHDTLGR